MEDEDRKWEEMGVEKRESERGRVGHSTEEEKKGLEEILLGEQNSVVNQGERKPPNQPHSLLIRAAFLPSLLTSLSLS